jgi:MFS family permease
MAGGFFRRNFGGLSRTTFLLALSSMFADISTEMLYLVLPIFLTQTLHATGSIVGLVDGFAQALQNIVQGFSGTLSDKLQRRKADRTVRVFHRRHRQAAHGIGDGLAGRVRRAPLGPARRRFALGAARCADRGLGR